MRLAVFHSLPEALIYGVVVLMLFLNIIGLDVNFKNAQQVKTLAAQNQKLAAKSEQQVTCISSFFLIEGTQRASSSLRNLAATPACATTIKSIQR
jgi:hypothetical protein